MMPSEVILHAPLPLVGTLGRCEREIAAALIVRVCQANGDTWQAVTPKMIREVLEDDERAGAQPFASLIGNPFARPDFLDLVREGYASGDPAQHEPLALTEKALTAIAERHRQPMPRIGEEGSVKR